MSRANAAPLTGIYQRLARLPDTSIALAIDVREVLTTILGTEWELHDFPSHVLNNPRLWLYLFHHPDTGHWRMVAIPSHQWDQPRLPDHTLVDPTDAATFTTARRYLLWSRLDVIPAYASIDDVLDAFAASMRPHDTTMSDTELRAHLDTVRAAADPTS